MIYKSQAYILFIFIIHHTFLGLTQSPLTTTQLATGGTKSIITQKTFNLANPMSVLDGLEGLSLLASSENRFFANIHSNIIAFALNQKYQGFTFGFHDYGIEGYSSDTWSLGYSRKLSKHWYIGTQMKLFVQSVIENPNKYAASLDLAINYQFGKALHLSLLVQDIMRSSILADSYVNVGINWSVSQGINLYCEYQENISIYRYEDATLIVGLSYSLIDHMQVHIGINTKYQGPSIGFDYHWDTWILSIGMNNHSQLGQTGSFGIGKRF